jgi:hypothetical protein
MMESNKTATMIAFGVVVVLFLVFGGVAMNGGMMDGGMMGRGWSGAGWAWVPALLTLAVGIVLGWLIFAPKK